MHKYNFSIFFAKFSTIKHTVRVPWRKESHDIFLNLIRKSVMWKVKKNTPTYFLGVFRETPY